MNPLSVYLTPLFMDMDPDQGIEDEYKNKHSQVFSWRFLRALSFVDLVCFHPENQKFQSYQGNVEEQAENIHKKAPLREIVKQKQVTEMIVD